MDLKALNRGEIVATVGGILLGISIFLAWYSLGDASLRGSCEHSGGKRTGGRRAARSESGAGAGQGDRGGRARRRADGGPRRQGGGRPGGGRRDAPRARLGLDGRRRRDRRGGE